MGKDIGIIRAAANCAVHVFEPSPIAFATLSAAYGTTRDVILVNRGLGDVSASAVLYESQDAVENSSMYARRLGQGVVEHPVDVTTLDRYVVASGLQELDLLKIDVEGHEVRVLEGA